MRGQGLGDALLAHSLADLSRKGTRQTIIDWTTLTEFYGKHGFAVTRSYRAYRLAL
jgi:predicted acetyltransferase